MDRTHNNVKTTHGIRALARYEESLPGARSGRDCIFLMSLELSVGHISRIWLKLHIRVRVGLQGGGFSQGWITRV